MTTNTPRRKTAQNSRKSARKREKYWFDYAKIMAELDISRRTLARWIDDLEIEPKEFPDHLRVFLVLPQVEQLRAYGRVMGSRSQYQIDRYRRAMRVSDTAAMTRILRDIEQISQKRAALKEPAPEPQESET